MRRMFFGGACVAGRSNHPSLSLRRLRFRLFASWPSVGRAVRRPTQRRWARSTAAAASQGRLGAASSPCPEPRAVPPRPSPCCRNRERLSTLRTGSAFADGAMRSYPSHSASRSPPDRVGAVHRVKIERGCRIVRLTVGQHTHPCTRTHAHMHTRMRARSPAARPWHASRVEMLVSCPCYSALQGS